MKYLKSNWLPPKRRLHGKRVGIVLCAMSAALMTWLTAFVVFF